MRHGTELRASVALVLAGSCASNTRLPGEALEVAVQAELNRRYEAAHETEEVFPGATVAFVLADGRVVSLATGFADLESGEPMPLDARMPSGSVGKMFVAATALSLTGDGVIELDVPLTRWLGEKPYFPRIPNADSITVRNLLNHSSGLIDHVFDAESGFRDHLREQVRRGRAGRRRHPTEILEFALDLEPLFTPGTGFHYSDTNYILAGLVLQEATASTYGRELSKRILRPLNLTATSVLEQCENQGLVAGYAAESRELFGLPRKVSSDGALVLHPSVEWTGGGLITTSHDLALWAKALFEGEVIRPSLVREMLSSVAVAQPPGDPAVGYGLGVSLVRTEHGPAYRHGGYFPGFLSMVAYYPEHGVSVAMQINADGAKLEEHFDGLVRVILEAADTKTARAASPPR